MAEASVFDVARCAQILQGQIAKDDHIDVVGRDDVTNDYWVLTTREILVLDSHAINARLPLDGAQVSVEPAVMEGSLVVHIAGADAGSSVLDGTFRHPSKLTTRLSEMSAERPGQ